jgi:hypothetical protein
VITLDGSSGRIIRGSVSTIQEGSGKYLYVLISLIQGVDENYATLMKWAANFKRYFTQNGIT